MSQQNQEALEVDVGAANTPQELHSLLAEAFRFSDYYGHNWDAFDECIRDAQLPLHVEILGFEALLARLPREAKLLQRCVDVFVKDSGHDITIRIA